MGKKRKIESKTLFFAAAVILFFLFFENNLAAQQKPKSEVEKILEREAKQEIVLDSILNHIARKWEISVGFGAWVFINSSMSNSPEEPFFLPTGMPLWYFQGAWHITEKFSIDFSGGIHSKKDVPPTPSIFSIIGGNDLDIEGSGGGFLPFKVGGSYYLKTGRLMPFIGANAGVVLAKSQYTEVRGNIFDGISRTDYKMEDKVPVFGFITGVDCRASEYVSLNFQAEYNISNRFNETIGGYNRYHGLVFIVQLAIIL